MQLLIACQPQSKVFLLKFYISIYIPFQVLVYIIPFNLSLIVDSIAKAVQKIHLRFTKTKQSDDTRRRRPEVESHCAKKASCYAAVERKKLQSFFCCLPFVPLM